MAEGVLTTDEELDAALDEAKLFSMSRILSGRFTFRGSGLELLILQLCDGCQLPVPCEDLPELEDATPEQIVDFEINPNETHIWWPQIHDGLSFPEFLEYGWGNRSLVDRRDGGERYRFTRT